MAAWKQWVVKAAVVLGLSIALTQAVPALHSVLEGVLDIGRGASASQFLHLNDFVFITLLAAGGLYVSSLTTGGTRAFLFSLPVIAAGTVLYVLLVRAIHLAPTGAASPVMLVLLICAFVNHRSADHPPGQVLSPLGWMAAGARVGGALPL